MYNIHVYSNPHHRPYRVFLRSSEWMAATPFTVCDPTIARCAMLMLFSGLSSTMERRRSMSILSGQHSSTVLREGERGKLKEAEES